MKKVFFTVLFAAIWFLSLNLNAQTCEKNFLSTSGNKLVDASGNEVQLTGVNWFGFETSMGYFHGIWSRDMTSMLLQIKDQGFNCIRIPWHNGMLSMDISGQLNSYGTDPYTGVSPMNEVEATKTTPIEILDLAIEWCQENNLKVILDNHSRNADGYMNEALWYTDEISHDQWIEDWVFMANRYKEYDAVIAMDINNEPHGAYGAGARWGTGDESNDWRLAAQECGNAILAAHPDVLIMVEGTEEFGETSYWWGGNLQGAEDYPVVLSDPSKLFYSPHEYGPTVFAQEWFTADDFPDNMDEIWETNFNYLHTNGTSPLLFGEFGIRDAGGTDEIWFDKFLSFIGENNHSWTYWCWNPNSGDTGGLLDNDWSTIVEWKMEKLIPYLADEIPNCATTVTVSVTDVSLAPTSISLTPAATQTLTATITPTNASNTSVSYSSSNTSVATVSSAGLVSAIAEGSATITVTTEDGGYTATSTITVSETSVNVDVEGVEVSPTSVSIETESTTVLSATALPTNASNQTLTWSSANAAIATVNSTGTVTGISEGSTTITVTTEDGYFTATSTITVTEAVVSTCSFGTPLATSLASINSTYTNVYVSDNGPDLSNVSIFTINWDLTNNGLWQMSFNTNDGNPTWWIDLSANATQTFSSTEPSLSFSGTGFTGLDGDYYVALDNDNFVMVEQSNAYTIYFSNSDESPCEGELKEASSKIVENAVSEISVYPNPFSNEVSINFENPDQVNCIEVYNTLGQLIKKVNSSDISQTTTLSIEGKKSPYVLKIQTESNVISKILIKN